MNRVRLGGLLAALVLCAGAAVQAGSGTSVHVKLDSAVTIKGETLSPGDYKLSWTAEGAQADVTIAQKGKVVAKTKATLVEKDKAAENDMVVLRKGSDGSQVLAEVHRRGQKAVLVLSAS
jgi:hypothetical protein